MVLMKLGSTFIFLNSTFDICSFYIIFFFVGLVIFVWHGEKPGIARMREVKNNRRTTLELYILLI